jgi:hypothetical protein
MGATFQARDDEGCCSRYYNEFFLFGLLSLFFLLFVYLLLYLAATEPPPPWYSVSIGAITGLDPDMDLQDGRALDPAFNLTVRIDASLSGNAKSSYCLHKSTSVQVSYLRVPLAGGRVPEPGKDTCAAPGSRKDLAVVARGRGVGVPGFLLDSLAEDMGRGEAVFQVTLMSPGSGGWNVMTCWGKVGDGSTLEAPCVNAWVKASFPEPQPSGSGSGNVPVPWPWPGRRSSKVGRDVLR